jgi:hypothetical protein
MVVGNLTEDFLLDAVALSLESLEGTFMVHLYPIMFPLNAVFTGIDIPRSRLLCMINETPEDIKAEYMVAISVGSEAPVETPKPRATLTRIK